jgi:hypothetical protein
MAKDMPASTGKIQGRHRHPKANATSFKPGQSGNPAGKPPGSRNRISEAFISAMSDDFDTHGVGVIERVREEDPCTYLKLVAGLVPREYQVTPETAEGFAKVWEALGQASKRNAE